MQPVIGLPTEFVQRLERFVPSDAYPQILAAFAKDRPTTFRVNTLKSSKESLLPALAKQGFDVEPVPWFSDAFILTKGVLRDLTETSEYQHGFLYVQSLSSMLPPLILDPKPGEKVLDIAAAPGSKTTEMAALMKNEGEIVANDTSQVRLYRLKANLDLQGARIAKMHKSDARSLWQGFPEYFDKTLADVPCSMEGRFRTGDEKTYEDWSLKKVKDLAHLERWILRSAVSATKPGGTIVYSTCTLSPEENEDVVDWILEKEKGKVMLEEIVLPDCQFAPSLHTWGSSKFHASIGDAVRIYPSDTMEGFFVAKLRKVKSSLPTAARR